MLPDTGASTFRRDCGNPGRTREGTLGRAGGSKRHLSTTFAWGLCLAALVVASGLLAVALQERPNSVLVVLAGTAFAAGACGVALNWRIARARAHALHDPLTGLPNRVLLDDRVEQALRRSRRTGERFALVAVDLDGFKIVNDVHGHAVGDAVLRQLADRLQQALRTSDTVARVGGDEFVVLSLGATGDDEVAVLATRLRSLLREPFRIGGRTVEIGGSIGWAIHPDDGDTLDELLERADGNMYARKRDAAGETAPLRPGVDARVVRDVERAVEESELVVLYQPVIELASGEVRRAEALVRRLLPGRMLAAPATFVPHVERTPLMRELTLLVARDALGATRLFADTGFPLSVSVNVPFRVLDDQRFLSSLAELLAAFDAQPGQLTLELAPSSAGARAELDPAALARIGKLGVRLSLDDGGRAASFSALRTMRFDELKIDSSFVRASDRSPADAAIVHGLIDIGHSLRMPVVAEGVETRETWERLASWGCDLAQGFYVAEPRSAAEIADWLRSRWPAVA